MVKPPRESRVRERLDLSVDKKIAQVRQLLWLGAQPKLLVELPDHTVRGRLARLHLSCRNTPVHAEGLVTLPLDDQDFVVQQAETACRAERHFIITALDRDHGLAYYERRLKTSRRGSDIRTIHKNLPRHDCP